MPKAGAVTLSIYNMRGQLVRILVSGPRSAGRHKAQWDGQNEQGSHVATGVYVYRLEVKSPSSASGQLFVETKKLLLTK